MKSHSQPMMNRSIYKYMNNQGRFLHMKKDNLKNRYSLYYPKSDNQKKYVKYLENPNTNLLIVTGPAGTGKTLFACTAAINDLKCGIVNKIILTRPVVPVEQEDIGFLPGDIKKKMDPWTRPIFDILLEHYSQKEIDAMIQKGAIEICPLAYMRGRTFKKSFIIADEMQNSSPNQMKMVTTRIGKNSRMVITGDITQTDIFYEDKDKDKKRINGLADIIKSVKKNYNNNDNQNETNSEIIKLIELEKGDVERSEVVVKILDLYNDNDNNNDNNCTYGNQTLVEKKMIEKVVIIKNDTQVRELKKPGYGSKSKNIDGINDAALIPLSQDIVIKKYWWDIP
jgi:phosphate starvation-inducible PhoH-like protein